MIRKIICFVLALSLSISLISCKKKEVKGRLDVYCMEAGYGVEWCEELLKLFSEQDWVKEKYPNLDYNLTTNDVKNFSTNKLKAGSKNNTFDLLFGETTQTEIDLSILEELTDDVYNKIIPGESVTYEEKLYSSYRETNKYLDSSNSSEKNRYFIANWAGGMNGIFYNEDILNSLEISVPRTTQELVKACEDILALRGNNQGKYDKGYSFIQSKGLGYISYLFPVWWAQYEGLDGYTNYWNGIDDEALSINIFNQRGRLYSLQMFEELFSYDYNDKTKVSNSYYDLNSLSQDFMTQQSMFLSGYGVFHINGDWFENEMSSMKADIKAESGLDYSIKLMRTPIISELGTKMGITDEELAATVDYVDGVVTVQPTYAAFAKGYNAEKVIETVRAARGIVNASGPYHTAMIPSYASEKDVAKDFLLFMASDVALDAYVRVTNGASLPFTYNVKEKNPTLYNALSNMQKERLDYFNSNSVQVNVLPCKESFPLVRFGGLSEFSTADFCFKFAYADNTLTAQEIFDKTKEVWNEKKFNDALDKAGLKN